MTLNPQQLPYQIQPDALSGANDRAVQNILMSMPRVSIQVLEGAYVEPLTLTVAEDPVSIELARVVNLLQQDVPVQCSSLCHFIYRPEAGGAQITSIDGLTSNAASRYRFTFRITYKAQNGN